MFNYNFYDFREKYERFINLLLLFNQTRYQNIK